MAKNFPNLDVGGSLSEHDKKVLLARFTYTAFQYLCSTSVDNIAPNRSTAEAHSNLSVACGKSIILNLEKALKELNE